MFQKKNNSNKLDNSETYIKNEFEADLNNDINDDDFPQFVSTYNAENYDDEINPKNITTIKSSNFNTINNRNEVSGNDTDISNKHTKHIPTNNLNNHNSTINPTNISNKKVVINSSNINQNVENTDSTNIERNVIHTSPANITTDNNSNIKKFNFKNNSKELINDKTPEQKEKSTREIKKEKKQELRKAKKIAKDILISTKELLDFVDIDDNDRIVTKTGIINLFQIETKDIYSFSETERNMHIFNFVHFIRGLDDDFKIITMKFPVSTKTQQNYVRKRLSMTKNIIYKSFLEEKLTELERLEETRFNKEFYLMTFYKLNDDIEQKERKLGSITSPAVNLYQMTADKKIRILYKLNNMNSKIF